MLNFQPRKAGKMKVSASLLNQVVSRLTCGRNKRITPVSDVDPFDWKQLSLSTLEIQRLAHCTLEPASRRALFRFGWFRAIRSWICPGLRR